MIVGFVPIVAAQKKKELKKVVGTKQGAPVGTVRPDNNQLVSCHLDSVALGIAEDSESRGLGLDEDDHPALASILHLPLFNVNRNLVLNVARLRRT